MRFLAFRPGQEVPRADIEKFLPIAGPAATALVITGSPFFAAAAPADATRAIQAALAKARELARPGRPVDVVVPPGTYRYSSVLDVGADVHLRGTGGVLQAVNPKASAVHLSGNRSGALFLKIVASASSRGSTPASSGIWVGGVNPGETPVLDTLVIGNDVSRVQGAHVFAIEEHGGLWAFNYAHEGFADAFHHTGRSSYCQVVANRAVTAPDRGDDLYAFIGYGTDGDPVHHCSCIANWGRDGHTRGISAVGAAHVTIQDNDIARTGAAGVYIAREAPYNSYGTFSVWVLRNRIAEANLSLSHDGLLAFAEVTEPGLPSRIFGTVPSKVRDLIIKDNFFTNISRGIGNGFGIEVRSGCEGGVVTGNRVQGAAEPGIVVRGPGFSVSGNSFSAAPVPTSP